MTDMNTLARLRVYTDRCSECLFSAGAIVPPERRTQILAELVKSGSWFACHLATVQGHSVCCRGFWDANIAHHPILQIAERLQVVDWLPTPSADAVAEALREAVESVFNPDGHVRVDMGNGAWATVAPDCPPETLAALGRLIELARSAMERGEL